MPIPEIRERLLEILARKDLRSETLALAADVISVDARFNASVAEQKRAGEDIDVFELAGMYESWLEACTDQIRLFQSSKDERRLAEALRAARDTLRQKVTDLGRAF